MNFKNVVIFGDSYSTFKGFIPEGYAFYYSPESKPETDVTKVEETWWHLLLSETGSNLVLNNSWSGSTIGYTGYNNSDRSKSSSFIYRFEVLLKDGFFKENQVDSVFIFGGTNDSWANVALGEEFIDSEDEKDFFCVLPAVSHFLKRVKTALPNTNIYCLINTDLKPEIACTMKECCEKYGIFAVAFEQIDKRCGHPTIKGMQDIKNQILEALK